MLCSWYSYSHSSLLLYIYSKFSYALVSSFRLFLLDAFVCYNWQLKRELKHKFVTIEQIEQATVILSVLLHVFFSLHLHYSLLFDFIRSRINLKAMSTNSTKPLHNLKLIVWMHVIVLVESHNFHWFVNGKELLQFVQKLNSISTEIST